MGNKKITIQSLEVVSIDEERSLILVKGGVPGSIGGWVEITDAKKKSLPANVPYPAGTKANSKNSQKENTNTNTQRKRKISSYDHFSRTAIRPQHIIKSCRNKVNGTVKNTSRY